MPTYRFCGTSPRDFPTLGRLLKPGDQFEGPDDLRHPDLKVVPPRKSAPADDSTPPEEP